MRPADRLLYRLKQQALMIWNLMCSRWFERVVREWENFSPLCRRAGGIDRKVCCGGPIAADSCRKLEHARGSITNVNILAALSEEEQERNKRFGEGHPAGKGKMEMENNSLLDAEK
jgi:hypothetical protein